MITQTHFRISKSVVEMATGIHSWINEYHHVNKNAFSVQHIGEDFFKIC